MSAYPEAGTTLKALNAMRLLIKAVREIRTRGAETEAQRRILDAVLMIADKTEREARAELEAAQ